MAQEPKRAPPLLSHQEDRLWKWVGRYVQPRVDRRKHGRIWEQSYNPIVPTKVENRRAPALRANIDETVLPVVITEQGETQESM